jgi:hypothetical protein
MKFKVTWSKPKTFEEGNFNIDGDGVYLIGYRDTTTNTRYIIYIGQGEIGDRLAYHHRNNRRVQRRVGQDDRVGYYRYSKVGREADRLDIELALYQKYDGERLCNEVVPPGSGRYQSVEVDESFL